MIKRYAKTKTNKGNKKDYLYRYRDLQSLTTNSRITRHQPLSEATSVITRRTRILPNHRMLHLQQRELGRCNTNETYTLFETGPIGLYWNRTAHIGLYHRLLEINDKIVAKQLINASTTLRMDDR